MLTHLCKLNELFSTILYFAIKGEKSKHLQISLGSSGSWQLKYNTMNHQRRGQSYTKATNRKVIGEQRAEMQFIQRQIITEHRAPWTDVEELL